MIFKYSCLNTEPDCEYNRSWHYLDNVSYVQSYIDLKSGTEFVKLHFNYGNQEDMTIAINDLAYLMNDSGKTIESFGKSFIKSC